MIRDMNVMISFSFEGFSTDFADDFDGFEVNNSFVDR